MEMASSYCERECPGHGEEPRGGHLWPGEIAQMDSEEES